jgi:hypothetical protein
MIRPLRRRHLWLVGAVAVLVAPLYLAALAARPAPAVQEALPAGLAQSAESDSLYLGTSAALNPAVQEATWTELPTTPPIRLRPVAKGAIEAAADGFVEGADLLLYWAPAEGSREMATAHLLGALGGGERQLFELPAAAARTDGVIILYSLGHDEEVAYVPWPAPLEAAP